MKRIKKLFCLVLTFILLIPTLFVFPEKTDAKTIATIRQEIDKLEKIGYMDTDIHDIEVIDRMEKCIVKDRNGLEISTLKQKKNLHHSMIYF